LYQIVITSKCSQELARYKKERRISQEELVVLRTWINEMKLMGPDYVRKCGYWNDHALRGKRAGQRSSSFSDSGRIIYKIGKNKIVIKIVKITPDHNY
jgi:mRNA-degrading endonuclease YafQ of YafQ-DinJ toxin-antitoxin module